VEVPGTDGASGRTGVSAALEQRLDEDQSRVIVLDEQDVELAVAPRASRQ
jgi:adenylylsulfate kinase-like enzyme